MKPLNYSRFVFEGYHFDSDKMELRFEYSFDSVDFFEEILKFDTFEEFNPEALDFVCRYTYLVSGASYYKLFPYVEFDLKSIHLSKKESGLLRKLYRGGLSQYIYENDLDTKKLPVFDHNDFIPQKVDYNGQGLLLMQSGGKDSLLSAELLKDSKTDYTMIHVTSNGKYPQFLEKVGKEIVLVTRKIDLDKINEIQSLGGLNGHVPFSAIYAGIALIQSVLLNKSLAVASIETSAEEPNLVMDNGFEVNHQYSKKYEIEQAIQGVLTEVFDGQLNYGSILRPFNELMVAKLFSKFAWPIYKNDFSSCNLINYKQNTEKIKLLWDGKCPKCANTFLVLSPFVNPHELIEVFSGKNMLESPDMFETYNQLFGESDVKPLECVGTYKEMRYAYKLARERYPEYYNLFKVDEDDFDLSQIGGHQSLFDKIIDYEQLVEHSC